jgi:transposase-like protein
MRQGRKYSVDEHPQKEKIVKAIIKGDKSLRDIAKLFDIHTSCIARYLNDRLISRAAAVAKREEEQHGKSLLDRVENVMVRMQKLYDACDEYLQDPKNPERYDLGPKSWEIDIVYRTVEPDTGKMIVRKESLDALLLKLDSSGYQPWEVKFKHADPRKLIIETANSLSKNLELIAKIQGAVQEAGGDTTVNVLVINTKKELDDEY